MNGKWTGWDDIGNSIIGSPEAVTDGQGKIFLTARGNNGAMWSKTFDEDHGGWDKVWFDQGGQIVTEPGCAVSLDPLLVKCIASGTGGTLWIWSMGPGQSWAPFGGATDAKPSAILFGGDNLLLAFRKDENGNLFRASAQKLKSGSGPWTPVGGPMASGPSCINMAPMNKTAKPDLHCFFRVANGSVTHMSWPSLE